MPYQILIFVLIERGVPKIVCILFAEKVLCMRISVIVPNKKTVFFSEFAVAMNIRRMHMYVWVCERHWIFGFGFLT